MSIDLATLRLFFIIAFCASLLTTIIAMVVWRRNRQALNEAFQQAMRGRETCGLEGTTLNYWVAQAIELPVIWKNAGPAWNTDVPQQLANALGSLDFTTNWSIGGPVLERNWAAIAAHTKSFGGDSWEKGVWQSGDLLEWSMKALVASKYGEYVPCKIEDSAGLQTQ